MLRAQAESFENDLLGGDESDSARSVLECYEFGLELADCFPQYADSLELEDTN